MKLLYKIFFIIIFCCFSCCFGACYNVNSSFFSEFNDKYLEKYIQEALFNNHELKQANYSVEQYRYEVKTRLAREFPTLSVGANYLGTHFPNNDVNIFVKDSAFIMPFVVQWEPDLLLKNADKVRSQKEIYLSELAKQRGIYLSLLTDVANAYLNILLYDYLIEKQTEIVEDKIQNANFNKNKYNFGVISLIDLNDVFAELFSQKILLDNLLKMRKTTLCNFCVLLGRSAYDTKNTDELERSKLDNFEYQKTIPDDFNYEVIENRPDIIEANHRLKSSKIDITVAKKDFFPNFNIQGVMFFDTSGPGNFFAWESTFAALIAGVSQDLFRGGERIANLKIKKARYYELMEKYKQTDLGAIKEVVNALNMIREDTKSEKYSYEQVALEKINLESAQIKLKLGEISKLEYLQAKNSFNQKEQLSRMAKAQRLGDYFNLYKAVGGQL